MDKDVIDSYRKAGKILRESLDYGEKLIKPGTPFLEICEKMEEKITSLGGELAFPAQLAKNAVAAHDCPLSNSDVKCEEGDVLKLDCGVHIDGFIADSAVTVNLGDYDDLTNSAKEALAAALKVIGIGVKVSEVGKAIQEVIESYKFAPVRNLSGHGLDHYTVHTFPSVPNYDSGSDVEFEDGMVCAVEPFASTGAGIVYESNNATLFSMENPKPVRNRMARTLMKEIDAFNGLPFTTRWLTKKHPEGMVRLALRELVREDVLHEYPPLIDKGDGIVSQAEHTIVFDGKPIVITKG